jgi:predicted DCC family thiol-disulfide oxidoreductase YuxK
MNAADTQLIVYDGNCYLCRTGAELVAAYNFIPGNRLIPFDKLDNDLQSKVDAGLFRSEMAVIDREKNETYYGIDAVLIVLSNKIPFLKRIRKGGRIYRLLRLLYRTIALNRYILFPYPSTVKCDCEPPHNRKYRLILTGFCILIATVISTLLGFSLAAHLRNVPSSAVVLSTLFAVGAGWILQMGAAFLFLQKEQLYDYLATLGVIMLAGVLILLPGLAVSFLHAIPYFSIMTACIVTSFITMTRMHIRRAYLMGLEPHWTLMWAVFLLVPVIAFYVWLP